MVIAAISSVRRVLINDQRLTEWFLLYILSTFLNILAVLNNAVFSITPTLLFICSFSIHPLNSFVTLARAHWMLISHNTFTSLFSTASVGMCLYHFSVFSNPFFLQRFQWTFLGTLSYHLLYSLWANISRPLTKCCTLSPVFPHNLHRGFLLVLSMWCFK